MKITNLNKISKIFFNYEDIAKAFNISRPSAIVTANRYVQAGLIIRLKRNLYILREKWESLGRDQLLQLGNLLQVPSYISLMTALSYYDITTQIQQGYIESISVKRTRQFNIENCIFTYSKIKPELYKDFIRENELFIAKPEKAFLDAIYLQHLGYYKIDLPSIDLTKLNEKLINNFAKSYPPSIQQMVKRL
ncbi:MAG: type IV toxin-antitoxin system AbiEi family antitoxin domain-containing protein [Calditrichaceae bacterium]|jgi:predicted transcriptional regulator of viral defense system